MVGVDNERHFSSLSNGQVDLRLSDDERFVAGVINGITVEE
jgi:hypothetical protein